MTMMAYANAMLLTSMLVMMMVAPLIGAQFPVCQVCGCSYCQGDFPMGNPTGVYPLPPQFLDDAPPGLTQIPCGLLDSAGSSGQIPADACKNAEWRLDPIFRTNCGCPPLPNAPPPCFGATIPILGLLFKLICLIFRLFT
jgi:hypothetical protein